MRFLPYEELKLRTTLNANEVFYRLRYAVQATNASGLFAFSAKKPYSGKVSRNDFKITRITWYQNSFKPVILGEISRDVFGSQVHITMRLDWSVFIFWIFWLGGVVLIGSNWYSDLIISAIQSQMPINLTSYYLIPIGMFAFGYLLALVSFKLEAVKSKKLLYDLLRMQSVNDDISFEETWFGLSEYQILSLAFLIVVAIAIVYFAIKLLN